MFDLFGPWTLDAAWEFFKGTALSTLIGVAATAIAVLTPVWLTRFIPQLRTWSIAVAVVAFSYTTVAGKFYHEGLSVKQAEWDAALNQETDNGEAARADAERTVRAAPPDSVRNDPWNRDNWRKK